MVFPFYPHLLYHITVYIGSEENKKRGLIPLLF
jgi:hypothetical protein